MRYLYCSTGGIIYRGEDLLGLAAGGAAARGGSSAKGCASPNPNPNGLWVRPAARGRQQPTTRVAPLQILMGCGSAVAAVQSFPIQYSNIHEARHDPGLAERGLFSEQSTWIIFCSNP
jgi:hypothetical protein